MVWQNGNILKSNEYNLVWADKQLTTERKHI